MSIEIGTILKNKITLTQRDICDGNFILHQTGGITSAATLGCTEYIPCNGVETITIKVPILTSAPTNGIAFYDENRTYISGVPRPQGTSGAVVQDISVPANAHFFRATYWNFANSATYGDFSCEINYPNGVVGYGRFRQFQTGQIHFSVKVNQSVNNFWGTDATQIDNPSYLASTGVVVLPDTYSATGKPVRAIMYCGGTTRNVSYTQWGLNDADWLAQKERFRAAGYAVFAVNNHKDSGGNAVVGLGSTQNVSAYEEARKWIVENYNIDPEIYVVGASAGGLTGINYCNSLRHVRSLALLSPWTDLFNCAWRQGFKNQFVELYGFSDAVTYEASKVSGYCPTARIITIGSTPTVPFAGVPTKMWIGSTESASTLYPLAIAYMQALTNGGNLAHTRIITGAGHEITNGGNLVSDAEVLSWFSKF